MEKKLISLNALLIPLAFIAGWSLSRATIVGKVGIHFLHREYTFLNSWWKGGLFFMGVWIVLEIIHFQVWKRYRHKINLIFQTSFLILAVFGLYFTYLDFNTFSHGLLGVRFHIGGYLFWIGWFIISIYFMKFRKNEITTNEDQGGKN